MRPEAILSLVVLLVEIDQNAMVRVVHQVCERPLLHLRLRAHFPCVVDAQVSCAGRAGREGFGTRLNFRFWSFEVGVVLSIHGEVGLLFRGGWLCASADWGLADFDLRFLCGSLILAVRNLILDYCWHIVVT